MRAGHATVVGVAPRRALVTRVSSGHVLMLLAGVLGALLTLNVLRAADRTRPVLVAAADLAPGSLIGGRSVRVARIHADGDVLASLFTTEDAHGLRGLAVTTTVRKGELLTRHDVRAIAAGAASRAMSFSLPRARAVAGKLAVGDRVDVIAVERETGRSGYVMTDAEVLALDAKGGGPLGSGDDVTVTLAADGDAAVRLAAALDTGTVTLVRATGAAALRDAPPFMPSGRAAPTPGGP